MGIFQGIHNWWTVRVGHLCSDYIQWLIDDLRSHMRSGALVGRRDGVMDDMLTIQKILTQVLMLCLSCIDEDFNVVNTTEFSH